MSPRVRRLILSNFFEIAAGPIGSIGNLFITAFVWRASDSLIAVALYSLGSFIFLPIAFWIDGHLLRAWNIRHAFWLGGVCAGIAMAGAVFLVPNPIWFFGYGCLYGLGWGMYWSNRNYLELQETNNGIRRYYFGIIYMLQQLAGVVTPFLAGWFIVLSVQFGWLTSIHAYWALFLIAFVSMLASAFTIAGGDFKAVSPLPLARFSRGSWFNERRLLNIGGGTIDGVGFLSALIILVFLGNEGTLGTIVAVVSIATAISMYAYGRLGDGRHRYPAMVLCAAVFLACALVLAFGPHALGAILYTLVANTAANFYFLVVSPILLDLCDREMEGDPRQRYSLILDSEVFLNLGRIVSVLIVLGLAIFVSPVVALVGGAVFGGSALLLTVLFVFLKRREDVPVNSTTKTYSHGSVA